jgi:hypothetical protein
MKNSVQDFFSHTTEPIEEAATKPSHNNIAKATEPETLMVVVAASSIGSVVWEKKSWTLFFINTSYQLASFIVAGLIFAWFN